MDSGLAVFTFLNNDVDSREQMIRPHNELSPFIHEVKMASPPFWGSTLFVSIPFGITNANSKKKYVKVCSEKNYMHFLVRHLDSNSRTAKLEQFGDMSLGYRGHNV